MQYLLIADFSVIAISTNVDERCAVTDWKQSLAYGVTDCTSISVVVKGLV